MYKRQHHNCVFVGLDENGEARHAHLRSTSSQGKVFRINVESSDIKHSFHKNGTDRSLYVFEAPIDLLSHITPVSYTHLDVYKRQGIGRAVKEPAAFVIVNVVPDIG